jgi:hypothetical protein
MTIGEDITVETVEALCSGCFAEPVAVEWGLGADCADFQHGSDMFKDHYGFRPRHGREVIIAWVRGETDSPWGW